MKAASLSHITLLCASLSFSTGCTDKITAPNNLCGVTRRASTEPLEHDPILFVHGYGENADYFCPMIDRFRGDGWAEHGMYAYNYSFVLSHADNAEEIRKQVDKILSDTKATKVDIISHSAGSVSSRYYLKDLAGTSKVDAWVSLAGPNHRYGRQLLTDSVHRDPHRLPVSSRSQLGRRDAGPRALWHVVVAVRRDDQSGFQCSSGRGDELPDRVRLTHAAAE